jgi:hypothetical protein
MIVTHLIAMAIAAALAFAGAWNYQENHYETKISELSNKAMKEKVDAFAAHTKEVDRVRANEQAKSAKYQGALNEARTREISLRRERDVARSDAERMREQTASDARRLADPSTSAATVLGYATAAAELLADCSRRYQEVAGAADGHASDVRTFIEAWPRQ